MPVCTAGLPAVDTGLCHDLPMLNFDPARLPHLMDLLLDTVCVVDAQGRFVYVSGACEQMFGYLPDDMVGRRMIELVHPDDRERTLATVTDIVAGQPQPNFENRYLRKDGSIVHVLWSARWSPVDQVRVAVAHDITERKRAEAMRSALYAISEAAYAADDVAGLNRRVDAIIASLPGAPDAELKHYAAAQVSLATERLRTQAQLRHMALNDPLTGLPKRELFDDRLDSALARARRDQTQVAVLYLDLDHFKQVNDTLGHSAGDALLQEVALRMTACVRESDTVGRIGGDEFLVLQHSVHVPTDTALVAEKIRQSVAQPFILDGHTVTVAPSIGIACYPAHGADGPRLIQRADEAMYEAKKAGGNQFRFAANHAGASGPPSPAGRHPAGSDPAPTPSAPDPETPPAAGH
jgi:diguanylate cyclase (GGDEF)-like protein/PAS domain S-box-containing protein